MFTSEREHRLLLRIDNAGSPLDALGQSAGLVDDRRWDVFRARQGRFAAKLLTTARCDRLCARLVATRFVQANCSRIPR